MKISALMRKSVLLTLALLISSGSLFATGIKNFNLNPDTSIKLLLLETLRSGRAQKGARINYRVDEDVLDANGNVLIKKGTPAYGTVLNSRASGAWGKRGALDISVDYTTAVDGQKVALRGSKETRGGGDKSLVVAGALLVAWPLMFCKGSNVTMESGTNLIVYVDDNLNIDSSYRPLNREYSPQNNGFPEADRNIVMKNGDQIPCNVIELKNGVYAVNTKNGVLNIKESDIQVIEFIDNQDTAVQNPETDKKSALRRKIEALRKK
jgi:hypothetical protein